MAYGIVVFPLLNLSHLKNLAPAMWKINSEYLACATHDVLAAMLWLQTHLQSDGCDKPKLVIGLKLPPLSHDLDNIDLISTNRF